MGDDAESHCRGHRDKEKWRLWSFSLSITVAEQVWISGLVGSKLYSFYKGSLLGKIKKFRTEGRA